MWSHALAAACSYGMQIERCPSEVDATQHWQRIIDFVCGSSAAKVWFEFKSKSAQELYTSSLEASNLLGKGQEATGTGND
jgi:hypothetical protein